MASGGFESYSEALVSALPELDLPVFIGEVGDTWMYGTASDPRKVRLCGNETRNHRIGEVGLRNTAVPAGPMLGNAHSMCRVVHSWWSAPVVSGSAILLGIEPAMLSKGGAGILRSKCAMQQPVKQTHTW